MEVVITCLPKDAGAERVTNENIPEEKATEDEAAGDEEAPSHPDAAAVEKEKEELNGVDDDFLPAEESPAPPADDRLKSVETEEGEEEKGEKVEEEIGEEKGEDGEEEKEGGEEEKGEDAPEDAPEPEAEKEEVAEAAPTSQPDDEPIQICVKDSSDGDVLTFRVRPSKSVGKMINAWKSNQPQYKQQCHTFAFYFGDKELVPTMTFADLPGLTEGSTIEVVLTPKEAPDEEEEEGKAEKRELKEKPEKAAKKARVAKEKVEKPAKEKAAPKEKAAKKPKHEKKDDAGTGADVSMTAKIQVQQENPKRSGTKSYERYGGYKKASTRAEYYELGGAKADWTYDFSRGWISVLEEE